MLVKFYLHCAMVLQGQIKLISLWHNKAVFVRTWFSYCRNLWHCTSLFFEVHVSPAGCPDILGHAHFFITKWLSHSSIFKQKRKTGKEGSTSLLSRVYSLSYMAPSLLVQGSIYVHGHSLLQWGLYPWWTMCPPKNISECSLRLKRMLRDH